MNKPLITVIVPLYNVEQYLRRCIESIICQTYDNLEIILVDDGSQDQSGVICDEYAFKDKRIKVIHQNNAGVSEARNAGIDNANGNYIQFVDGDDWIERDACKKALDIAIEQNADIVWFGFREVFPKGKIVVWGKDLSGEQDKKEMMGDLLRLGIRNNVWSKLFAVDLFDGVRFPKGRVYSEDVAVVYKLVHYAKKIYATDEILYNYMRRKGSSDDDPYRAHAIKDRLVIHNERLLFLKQYYPEYVDWQLTKIFREMLIGKQRLKDDPDYNSFLIEYNSFYEINSSKVYEMTKYNRLIWLFYYCRPLAYLFIKWRYVIANRRTV